MKKNNLLFSQFGMSMVEIMIAAGLIGGLSLGVAKLMENSTKAAKTIEAKDEISLLTNQINDVLKNPNNCEATFGSKKEGDPVTMVYQVLGGVSVPKYTATNFAGAQVQIQSMVLKDIDGNGSNGSSAIATFELTFKKPEKSTFGGRTIKKEITLNANLCKKNYIENTSPSALIASCTGPNKLLLAGPNAWAGSNWAVCQDCTDAVSTGVINSCASSGSGGGVDIADMNSNTCVMLGGVYDPSKPGCTFNGKTFPEVLSMIMTDIASLQTSVNKINQQILQYPSSLVDTATPSCPSGSIYSLMIEGGRVKLKCEPPATCSGCAAWSGWTLLDKGYVCQYSCGNPLRYGTRTTCRYTRTCTAKTPANCVGGNINNQLTGFYPYLESNGGDSYANNSIGERNALQQACPGASTFGL